MEEKTYLYVLVFPVAGLIKIGKADDIHARIRTLEKHWGGVDYPASYHLAGTLQTVIRLEKALHTLLEHFSTPAEVGDGKTELFSLDALPVALQHIALYTAQLPDDGRLQHGIPLVPPRTNKPKRSSRRDRLLQRSEAMVTSVRAVADQFGRINRLLTFLLRRQNRIAFQYDLVNQDEVRFRVRLTYVPERGEPRLTGLMDYFLFRVTDLQGMSAHSGCEITAQGNVVQFTVRLPSDDSDSPRGGLFTYFIWQTKEFLARLPLRSSAATEPIPQLN